MSDPQQTPPPPELSLTVLKVVRQMSIPVWVRLFSLLVAIFTFIGCVWLIAIGTVLCKGSCDSKVSEIGTTLLGSTFVPVLILTYLAFARTGIEALKKRTDELLLDIIPSVFNRPITTWNDEEEGITQLTIQAARHKVHLPFYRRLWRSVTNKGYEGSSSERYAINAQWGMKTVNNVVLLIDLNLLKINIGLKIPKNDIKSSDQTKEARALFEEIFGSVFEGAKHEGYYLDNNIVQSGSAYMVVARLRISEDFIWNPARQLHFAQDLKNYVVAFMSCWSAYQFSNSTKPDA